MSLPERYRTRVEEVLDTRIERSRPLSGGCVGEVYGVTAGDDYVVKVENPATDLLATEGRMLRYLAEQSPLPAPNPVHFEPGLLVMPRFEGDHHFDDGAERHAADLLAAMHAQPAPHFGFEFDTVIGGSRLSQE